MFTVSVGNLPPGASVLIKITYVAELLVEGEKIIFSLPGSVAPWKREAALEEETQVCINHSNIYQIWEQNPLNTVNINNIVPFDFFTMLD